MDLFVSNNVLQIFEKEIENDISQSFLFYGDKGLGVFYAAKVFARSLVCENKVLGCCEKCYFCKESAKNCYDEIIVLEKEKEEDSIRVEGVKRIYKKLYYKPQYGRKKVLIIKDAEKLTDDAKSALLKIIEEPKKDLIIILVTSNKDALFDTILSRVICVNFFKPNKKETIKFLEKRSLKDKELILFFVEYFNNMVADCVKYLENDELFKTEKKNILSFIKLYKSSFYEASLYIKKISEKERDGDITNKDYLKNLVSSWIRFLEFNLKIDLGFIKSDFLIKNNLKLDIPLKEKISLLSGLKHTYESLEDTSLNKRLLFETLFLGRMYKIYK